MNRVIRHVPNALTLLRLAAVPFFVLLMLENRWQAAAVLFLLAEATDVLDGYIARKYQVITRFGRIMDPAADKLMQLAALFMLTVHGVISIVIPCLVLVKELFMVICSIYVIRQNYDTSAKWFGKTASVLFFIAIMLAFFGVARPIVDAMMWICVGMTLFAGIMYSLGFLRHSTK